MLTSSENNQVYKVTLESGRGGTSPTNPEKIAANTITATINTVEDKDISLEDFIVFTKQYRTVDGAEEADSWVQVESDPVRSPIRDVTSTPGETNRSTFSLYLSFESYPLNTKYDVLVIRRESALYQRVADGQLNGIELQLDKVVEFAQDNKRELDSTIKIIDSDTGNPKGGYVEATPNSLLHFDEEGNPETVHIGDNTNVAIRSDLGEPGDVADLGGSAFGRIAENLSRTQANDRAISGVSDRLDTAEGYILSENEERRDGDADIRREFAVADAIIVGDGTATSDLKAQGKTLGQLKSELDGLVTGDMVTVPFWTIASTQNASIPLFDASSDNVLFRVRESVGEPRIITNIERFVSGVTNTSWTYGWGPFGDPMVGTSASARFNAGTHDLYLHVGQAYKNSSGDYVVDKASFSPSPYRILGRGRTIGDVRASDIPSNTFIQQTLVDPAVRVHNSDVNAHAGRITSLRTDLGTSSQDSGGSGSVFLRLKTLRDRPSGGASADAIPSPLRVLAVNGGVDIFHSESAIPDVLKLAVRNTRGTAISGAITCDFAGHTIPTKVGALTINDFNDGGLSSTAGIGTGTETGVHLQISSAVKTSIRSRGQIHGAAFFSLYSDGTRVAMFSVAVKANLSEMIGGMNLSELLGRGLPSFMQNMFTTVLSRLNPAHIPTLLLAGEFGPSVVITDNVPIPESAFEEYKKAEWLYLVLGPAQSSITQSHLRDGSAVHIRIPLESMNRSTGELFYREHYRANGNLTSADIDITVSTRRVIGVTYNTRNLSGIGPDILSATAYVPSYFFPLELSISARYMKDSSPGNDSVMGLIGGIRDTLPSPFNVSSLVNVLGGKNFVGLRRDDTDNTIPSNPSAFSTGVFTISNSAILRGASSFIPLWIINEGSVYTITVTIAVLARIVPFELVIHNPSSDTTVAWPTIIGSTQQTLEISLNQGEFIFISLRDVVDITRLGFSATAAVNAFDVTITKNGDNIPGYTAP